MSLYFCAERCGQRWEQFTMVEKRECLYYCHNICFYLGRKKTTLADLKTVSCLYRGAAQRK